MLARKLKKEIETLPPEVLQEAEDLIRALRYKKQRQKVRAEKALNVFDMILDSATNIGITDWARNHDHYLYGTEKR